MPIRLKKRFSRKVTNKKHKSKRSKSKKQRTRKQNTRKQKGGNDDKSGPKMIHGEECKWHEPKFKYSSGTYIKGEENPGGKAKVLICKKSLKKPFSKNAKKRSSTLPIILT